MSRLPVKSHKIANFTISSKFKISRTLYTTPPNLEIKLKKVKAIKLLVHFYVHYTILEQQGTKNLFLSLRRTDLDLCIMSGDTLNHQMRVRHSTLAILPLFSYVFSNCFSWSTLTREASQKIISSVFPSSYHHNVVVSCVFLSCLFM